MTIRNFQGKLAVLLEDNLYNSPIRHLFEYWFLCSDARVLPVSAHGNPKLTKSVTKYIYVYKETTNTKTPPAITPVFAPVKSFLDSLVTMVQETEDCVNLFPGSPDSFLIYLIPAHSAPWETLENVQVFQSLALFSQNPNTVIHLPTRVPEMSAITMPQDISQYHQLVKNVLLGKYNPVMKDRGIPFAQLDQLSRSILNNPRTTPFHFMVSVPSKTCSAMFTELVISPECQQQYPFARAVSWNPLHTSDTEDSFKTALTQVPFFWFEYVVILDELPADWTGIMQICQEQVAVYHNHGYDTVVHDTGLVSCRASKLTPFVLKIEDVDTLRNTVLAYSTKSPTVDLRKTNIIIRDNNTHVTQDEWLDCFMAIKDYRAARDLVGELSKSARSKEEVSRCAYQRLALSFLTGDGPKPVMSDIVNTMHALARNPQHIKTLFNITLLVVEARASHRSSQESAIDKACEQVLCVALSALKDALMEGLIDGKMCHPLIMRIVRELVAGGRVMTKESLVCVMKFMMEMTTTMEDENAPYKVLLNPIQEQGIFMVIYQHVRAFAEDQDVISLYIQQISKNNVSDKTDSVHLLNNGVLFEFVYTLGTSFTPYVKTMEDLFAQRERTVRAIRDMGEYLDSTLKPVKVQLEKITHLPVSNFYLSYQGVPSKDIFLAKSQLLRRVCPDLDFVLPTKKKTAGLRVCFHSSFLTRRHSVYKDRHRVIAQLSLDPRFEKVYFSGFQDLNPAVQFTYERAEYVKLDQDLAKARDTLAGLELDVLVYCEIGMCPFSYYLAHMKLAPVQVNTWGHSDTGGISGGSIDYFVSSRLFEVESAEEAQSHYAERLVLMDSLSTCYVNPSTVYRRDGSLHLTKTKLDYGFGPETHVYFCLQSPFKISPEFDAYITGVLEKDPLGVVWLMGSRHDLGHMKKIISRLPSTTSQRVHLFPLSDHHAYMSMMNASTVVLDIYPFGGCNSSFEAFSLDKPVVTRPSVMISGRFTHGMYLKMGMKKTERACAVTSVEQYIELAVDLANNTDGVYDEITQTIRDSKYLLYEDPGAIKEWAEFLCTCRQLSHQSN